MGRLPSLPRRGEEFRRIDGCSVFSGSGRGCDSSWLLPDHGNVLQARGTACAVGNFFSPKNDHLIMDNSQSAWFLGNCISTVIGGVVAYGIGSIEIYTIASWQLLFLFLGAITAGISFFLIVFLPDSPKNAIFLTNTERAIALQRTLKNKTGVMDAGSFKWGQAWLAIRDPQTWFLVLYTFCVNLCNGGVTSVS